MGIKHVINLAHIIAVANIKSKPVRNEINIICTHSCQEYDPVDYLSGVVLPNAL